MSTNYYFTPANKSKFASIRSLHIGKMTMESFNFHGVRISDEEVDVCVGSVYFSIKVPKLNLTSAKEWREFLRNNEGVIKNEYDEVFTAEDFIASIEGLTNSPYKHLYCDDNSWLDEEGYTFSDNIFF